MDLVERMGLDGYWTGDCKDPDSVLEWSDEWVDTDGLGETADDALCLGITRPSDAVPAMILDDDDDDWGETEEDSVEEPLGDV